MHDARASHAKATWHVAGQTVGITGKLRWHLADAADATTGPLVQGRYPSLRGAWVLNGCMGVLSHVLNRTSTSTS